AVRGQGLEGMEGRGADRIGYLLERSHVIENEKAAAVGPDHEIVEVRLHGQPVDGSVRQLGLERLPTGAIVEGDIERVLRAGVEKPPAKGVLADDVGIGK